MRICLVASIGGHLTELIRLKDGLLGYDTFVITNSLNRAIPYRQYPLPVPPFTLWRVLMTCFHSLIILLREKPDVIVSSGAEIAVPAFLLSRFLGIKTIFIETVTRFDNPTISGRLCYPFSDVFLVQHRELLKAYGPRAQYRGRVL